LGRKAFTLEKINLCWESIVESTLERAWELKQALTDFVYDAEGELAEALEAYAANQLRQRKVSQDMIVDEFLTVGKVGTQTPLALFLADQSDLSKPDRQLLDQWQHTFTGLFAIEEVLPDGFRFMNWLTAKAYSVKPNSEKTANDLSRLKPGEILLTRLAPLSETEWMISGPYTQLGKLGKPKLAVAIGNFKDNHKRWLYSDAPDLLEEAWQSVERYHTVFLDFFGSDEITMSGYEFSKKIAEFQEKLTAKYLADAGIDQSKSLDELAAEAGMTEEELEAAAEEAGVDPSEVSKLFKQSDNKNGKPKMMAPQVQLPDELKKAEQLTVLAHPRWGQAYLPTYSKLKTVLETADWQSIEGSDRLIRHYLEAPEIKPFVWHRLAEQYPQQLESVLQTYLNRPTFKLQSDLDPLLETQGKSLEPELPEIASVPIHLHNLFEEAIQEVQKSKSKDKKKTKKTGFGA
jgi:hypothetical protein